MKSLLLNGIYIPLNRSVTSCCKIRFSFLCFILMFLLSPSVFAQQITVTGKVSRGDTAITGATVAVKNTSTATVTNDQGMYSISAPPNAVLVISSVGFETQEMAIGNRSLINFDLQSVNQQLEDVIVVGYGTQRRGNITGAVANIKSEELMR